jgi:hypothetical protein
MSSEIQVQRRSKVRLIVIVCVILLPLAFVGYTIWWMYAAHSYEPGEASNAADVAELTSVPPPPEARDLRVASFEHMQARLVFVRFSAPVDVCRRYAAAVLPNSTLKTLDWNQRNDDLGTVATGSYRLQDLSWFDLPYLHDLWTTSPAGKRVLPSPSTVTKIPEAADMLGADADTSAQGYLSTTVRVDAGRGVFYFMRAN